MGLNRAWFMSTAAPGPHSWAIAGAGSMQNSSDHVMVPLSPSPVLPAAIPTNDESLRIPLEAFRVGLNGTGIRCVTSMTESIRPAAPQYTLKSAARATDAVIASQSRVGKLRTVAYASTWNSESTPGSAPAVRLTDGCGKPGRPHVPPLGEQLPPLGLTVFSFAAPAPQRGPLKSELEGEEFGPPRPQPVMRHGAPLERPTEPFNW